MNCFPCFGSKQESRSNNKNEDLPVAQPIDFTQPTPPPSNNAQIASVEPSNTHEIDSFTVKSYTFRELATATKNFRQECLLGEGNFGRVFKGTLQSSGQIAAIRQLDRNGVQGSKEFVMEVSQLSLLDHPNLVKLVGYCADGDQRILIYEYLASGSLKSHLHDLPEGKRPLDWSARMNIAVGIAQGLEYLHETVVPPIIYRDLKPTNIMLDEAHNPRLSEYGLAKLAQSGNKMHVAGCGYCAPEYERSGELTSKSDVYSFGVILLELITGRQALDTARPADEQNLVSWAQPIFRDPSKFPEMADPLLSKQFVVTSLNQAVGVAAMCLQEEPSARPLISDISAALSFLAMAPPEAPIPARLVSILSSRGDILSQRRNMNSFRESNVSKKQDSSDSEDEDQEMHQDNGHELEHDKSGSDYEYGDSSESSDYEQKSRNKSHKLKNGDIKTIGSTSKRKCKKQPRGPCSRSSSRSSCSSSLRSRDYSIGFSLRCDSTFPDRNTSYNPRQDMVQESQPYNNNNSSSSD